MNTIKKNVSIIIVSFGSDSKIVKCLKRINKKYKKIIIENSGDLNLKKRIEKNFVNTKVIISKNNGYGAANNLGAKHAKTKYIFITSPDVLLEKKTIEKLFLTAERLREKFSILAPATLNYKNKNLKVIKMAHGHSLFMRKKKFQEIGGFDSKFFLYYEDEDLSKRISKENCKIYLVPKATVHHTGGGLYKKKLIGEIEVCKNWHYMWSKFYFNKKHNGVLIAYLETLSYFMRSLFKLSICFFLNKKKYKIYRARFFGLLNAYLGKSAWYRPKLETNE